LEHKALSPSDDTAHSFPLLALRISCLCGDSASGVFLSFRIQDCPRKNAALDNKSEFQIIIDMPEGTTLEQTAAVTREIGDTIRTVPEGHQLPECMWGRLSPQF